MPILTAECFLRRIMFWVSVTLLSVNFYTQFFHDQNEFHMRVQVKPRKVFLNFENKPL